MAILPGVCYIRVRHIPVAEDGNLEKGNKMRSIYRIVFVILLAVTSASFFSIPKADAEEGTCVLEANQDVFVIVWDHDDEGNKGRQIWQGRINQGKSVKITAQHGQIRYSYNDQPDEDQPLSGDTDRSCSNNEIILVP